MNALQKSAWWTLGWALAACAAVAAAWPWLGFHATGFFGLLGFAGFAALFLRKSESRAILDERDLAIATGARDLAMRMAYLLFIAGFLAIMLVFGVGPSVPGKWINLLACCGFASTLVVSSVYTLWQYRKDARDAASA